MAVNDGAGGRSSAQWESSEIHGVDLGTTFSCLSWVDRETGDAVVSAGAAGSRLTSSVVLFGKDGQVHVGPTAPQRERNEPARAVATAKRHMADPDWKYRIDGKAYTPTEIAAIILRALLNDHGRDSGDQVREVVIACPERFGEAARAATVDAGMIAGLRSVEIISEPLAAVLPQVIADPRDQVFLVYDLGGGTFDATLVRISAGAVTVISAEGIRRLGGRDWDLRIVDYLADRFRQLTGCPVDPLDDVHERAALWRQAEQLKHALSTRSSACVRVTQQGLSADITLDRTRFDELTHDLLERTFDRVATLVDIGRERGCVDIDHLLLVGGSSRMPQVAKGLRRRFGLTPRLGEPELAVAKGAAIYGLKLTVDRRLWAWARAQGGGVPAPSGRVPRGEAPDGADYLPVPRDVLRSACVPVARELGLAPAMVERLGGLVITDVTSHSYGIIATLDGPGAANGGSSQALSAGAGPGAPAVAEVWNLILAQETLPATRTQTFYTVVDDQREVDIQIVENSVRDKRVDRSAVSSPLTTLTLTMSRGLPARSAVEVEFNLARDGRLYVTGRDLAGGATNACRVIRAAHMSPAAIVAARERLAALHIQ
ncbi:Hsp70 family protein [Frankia sp. AiPa1]|uniref:Hsp70 family protein n=1 Tax=Frankia sp. AiPa1 TaxID=573492 RepID=UPI00202B4220|nr:Hsp70 family protein [Frankia sp. AiPa1]MCL9760256.1 Hsp70 family protein [Frankia sp. AiPa1]